MRLKKKEKDFGEKRKARKSSYKSTKVKSERGIFRSCLNSSIRLQVNESTRLQVFFRKSKVKGRKDFLLV